MATTEELLLAILAKLDELLEDSSRPAETADECADRLKSELEDVNTRWNR